MTDKTFDWYGKTNYWELPSTHPYWKYETVYRYSKNKIKYLTERLNNLMTCPNDNEPGVSDSRCPNIAASNIMGVPKTKAGAIKETEELIAHHTNLVIEFAKNYK